MSEPAASAERPAKSAPYSHCSSCGAPYADRTTWPRTCTVCGAFAYRNPLPVAVALQPVHDTEGMGLLVITRAIPPALGRLALPGGFVDHAEDWRHAVVRELYEETGVEADERDVRLADALSSPDSHLLLFGVLPPRPAAELPPFTATDETSDRSILRTPAQLGFPLHTVAAEAWFEGRYG
ncbi:NUDIX domain-containing protein [Streptomyces sp. NPDC050418]|uniref:NUDIX domain-containing protein n=1 Tax=Streptomyces sp. NPDC050418 TaxID=3365612 RepID=UPI0037A77EC7